MAKITPVVFPLNLGTADEIIIRTSFQLEDTTANIMYELRNSTVTDRRARLASGFLIMPEEIFTEWGSDNQYVIEYHSSSYDLSNGKKFDTYSYRKFSSYDFVEFSNITYVRLEEILREEFVHIFRKIKIEHILNENKNTN